MTPRTTVQNQLATKAVSATKIGKRGKEEDTGETTDIGNIPPQWHTTVGSRKYHSSWTDTNRERMLALEETSAGPNRSDVAGFQSIPGSLLFKGHQKFRDHTVNNTAIDREFLDGKGPAISHFCVTGPPGIWTH